MNRRYWLLKSEPSTFSIDDLESRPGRIDPWDGVRNYQARNFMRDDMKQGDLALFYHSGKAPAVVGTVSVVREAYPDATAQDPESGGFDPRSTPDNPVWYMVDVRFESRFSRPVPLADLRRKPDLADMQLLRKGNRLSVMPVTRAAFETIVEMGSGKA